MPTYRQYLEINEVERERLFMQWCLDNKRRPTEDGVGDDFLDDFCSESGDTDE